MQMREKVGKSRNTVFFQWFVGSKSRLAKAAGAEPAGQMRDEKLHAVVARSTCASQNVQNSWCSDRFCTPLWREAHFEVKMYKTHHSWTTFGSWDVEKVHAVVARSTFRSQNVQNTRGSDHFWTLRCRSAWQVQGIVDLVKSELNVRVCIIFNYNHHYTTLHSNTLHYNYNCNYNYTFTTFHYTMLHYTPLHSTTLNYTTLHHSTLHYTTFHYTPLHYITLHYIPRHYTKLRYIPLHYTTLHYTTLHHTPLHYSTLHYTTLHYTTLHSTTLQLHNYTPLH